ncbi:MAG: hypothetical protein ABJ092_02190 [Gillisia sp.]
MESSGLHLNKWFLDFVGDNGETMIFYAAKLSWKGFAVHYASWIHYDPEKGVKEKSHFRNVKFPEKKDEVITWNDDEFKISGKWESGAGPISARLYESDPGYLDWHCFQPSSRVYLKIKDRIIEGKGYVEQLILTAPPWHIPMNDLRWGRFHSLQDTMVWIELRKENKQQWVWLNGERMTNCIIEDDQISSAEENFLLKLDRGVELESENKLYRVMHNLLHYLPGFNKLIPAKFLMAFNYKWLSKAEFHLKEVPTSYGIAIHEWVNFNQKDQ